MIKSFYTNGLGGFFYDFSNNRKKHNGIDKEGCRTFADINREDRP